MSEAGGSYSDIIKFSYASTIYTRELVTTAQGRKGQVWTSREEDEMREGEEEQREEGGQEGEDLDLLKKNLQEKGGKNTLCVHM